MKTYVIHEVSTDNLGVHLEESSDSKLLAVIPETFDSSQLAEVLGNVFKDVAPPKIPAPSAALSKALVVSRPPQQAMTMPLAQMVMLTLKDAGKAMTYKDFVANAAFSKFKEGQIRSALYSLAYTKKIKSNGNGKYTAK